MITPNSRIRLVKAPFEIDKINQLTFANVTAQTNYFLSLPYVEMDKATYQREDGRVRFNREYDSIIGYNYCMYQNTSYSNKWFYAFIEKIEYANDGVSFVYLNTDAFQTWQFNIQYKNTFVEREHVNDDTIGLHTIPEGLETGEYTNHDDKVTFGIGSCHAVVCTSIDPFRQGETYPYNVVNSIPSGLHYFVVGDFTSVNFIGWLTRWAANESDLTLIQSIFIAPDSMTGYTRTDPTYWKYALDNGGLSYAPYHKLSTNITGSFDLGDITIPKPYNNIDGYYPKNGKLFVWPYNFLIVDNHGGQCEEFYYEDFQSTNCVFKTKGDITPGCSIRTIPLNYKHIAYNYGEGINALKLPIGSWQGDVYTNWLTQNSVNLATSLVSSTAGVVGGVATGNVAMAGGGAIGIAGTLGTIYQHSRIPNQVFGNQNSGDVTYSDNQSTFTAYKRTIKYEYARIIDNYFSMFGYKVARVKVPNIFGRANWNYVKTIDCNILGDIPQQDLQEIKSMFNNGVTFWHNPATFLDYSQNNPIV